MVVMPRLLKLRLLAITPVILLAGCGRTTSASQIDYQMGERVVLGPLSYNVIETSWKSQLGDEFKVRTPQQRFLLISISATNGGGHDVSIPLLILQGQDGKEYPESDNGENVDSWFGLLRTLNPAQTQQGRLVFDVPLGSYRLRLSDGGEPGSERYAWVTIPLHIDPETDTSPTVDPGIGK